MMYAVDDAVCTADRLVQLEHSYSLPVLEADRHPHEDVASSSSHMCRTERP